MPIIGQTPTGVLYDSGDGKPFELPADVAQRLFGAPPAPPPAAPDEFAAGEAAGTNIGPRLADAGPPPGAPPPDTLSDPAAPPSLPSMGPGFPAGPGAPPQVPAVDPAQTSDGQAMHAFGAGGAAGQAPMLGPSPPSEQLQALSGMGGKGAGPAPGPAAAPPIPLGEQRAQSLERTGQINADNARANAETLRLGVEADQRKAAEIEKMRATHEAQAERDAAELQHQSDTLNRMQVDPMHYFHSMEAWGEIASVIGMISGGWYAASTGRENPALKIISENINNDIDAQKANMAHARAGFEAQKGIYQMNLQRWGNQEVAADATKKQMWDLVARQIDLHTAQAASPLAVEAGKQAATQARMEAATAAQAAVQRQFENNVQIAKVQIEKRNADTASYHASIADRTEKHAHEDRQADLLVHHGDEMTRESNALLKDLMAAKAAAAKSGAADMKTAVPGMRDKAGRLYHATSDTNAGEIQKAKVGFDEGISNMDRMMDLRKQAGVLMSKGFGVENDAMKQLRAEYLQAYTSAMKGFEGEGSTRFSEEHLKLIKAGLGSADDWKDPTARLQEARKIMLNSAGTYFNNRLLTEDGKDFDVSDYHPYSLSLPGANSDVLPTNAGSTYANGPTALPGPVALPGPRAVPMDGAMELGENGELVPVAPPPPPPKPINFRLDK